VSSAVAARRSAARPAISSIGPSSVAVGDTLTIRGHGFLAGKRRNTVSFKRPGSPAVTAKAAEATATRIRVVVPAALARYLSDTNATRFRVRVRARRFSKASAALHRSVLVSPADSLPATGDTCEPAPGLAGDLVGPLDDALGTGLGDTLDTLIPDESCDVGDVPAAGDDPAAADDGADPGAGEPGDDSGAGDLADTLGADDTTTG
jgi:hypothetical protein